MRSFWVADSESLAFGARCMLLVIVLLVFTVIVVVVVVVLVRLLTLVLLVVMSAVDIGQHISNAFRQGWRH